MNEHIVQMVLTCVVAGLGAGWLTETVLHRRGHGLIVDMGLGVVASIVGGGALLALADRAPGTLVTCVIGFGLATSAILVQRLRWPCEPGARERRARVRLAELSHHPRAAAGTVPELAGAGHARLAGPTPARALARLATTGIYLLRGVPIEVQRAARTRAARDGTTLRQVLLSGLGEYAAGTWTPWAAERPPAALDPRAHTVPR